MSILDVFKKIPEIINIIGIGLDDLVIKIDAVRFDGNSIVMRFLGMFKYVVGDAAWLMICGMFYLSLGLFMYRALLIVLTVIKEIIPSLKGRIAIR